MILLRTLGDCAIEIGETRLAPDSEILFSLLTYLIVERGRPIAPSVLIEFFWADQDEKKARHCLRQCIYKLRRMGVPIETRNDRYVLAKVAASTDFERFYSESSALITEYAAGTVEVLPGFAPGASYQYLLWLDATRDTATAAIRRSLLSGLQEERRGNRWHSAERLAKHYLKLDPYNEEATLTLAEALALQGCKRDAVRVLDSYSQDVGQSDRELRVAPELLRRRIGETHILTSVSRAIPLVGRSATMAMLQRMARRAIQGDGQTCFIHGDPGIGKTRVVDEFSNLEALRGSLIVRAECRASASTRALSVFMELAPQLIRLPGALGCAPEAFNLVRRLAKHLPDTPTTGCTSITPDALHAHLRASILDLIDSIASERSLVLLVEDVHWIDHISLSVLHEIISSNKRRPALILITGRTDYRDAFHSEIERCDVSTYHLDPLVDTDARTLASELFSRAAVVPKDHMLDWCVAHASGNPLFLNELVEHWKDCGLCESIPPSLEALVAERLEKVSPLSQRVLQVSALMGNYASHELLAAVLSLPEWQLLDGIEELERNGFVSSSIGGVHPRHELLARTAVAKLTPTSRAFIHDAIARRLEACTSDGDSGVLWEAATHWSLAGDRHRALRLARKCALHVASVGLPFEASEVLRKALVFADTSVERLDLYELRRRYLRVAGSWEELIRNCESAIALEAQSSANGVAPHSAFELDLYAAHCAQHSASTADVIGRSMRCVQDREAHLSHRLAAASSGLVACYAECRELEAEQLMEAVRHMSPATSEDHKNALVSRLVFHIEHGDLSEATVAGDQLLALAELERDNASIARFLRLSAHAYRMTGDFGTVDSRLARARQIATTWQLHGDYRESLMAEGQQACAIGDFARAKSVSDELNRLFEIRPHLVSPTAYQVCAEIALMGGELEAADGFLRRLADYPTVSMRYTGDRLALRISAILLRGDIPSSDETVALFNSHQALCDKGGQDFPTATLYSALLKRGAGAKAQDVARRYARQRRERWTLRNKILLSALGR